MLKPQLGRKYPFLIRDMPISHPLRCMHTGGHQIFLNSIRRNTLLCLYSQARKKKKKHIGQPARSCLETTHFHVIWKCTPQSKYFAAQQCPSSKQQACALRLSSGFRLRRSRNIRYVGRYEVDHPFCITHLQRQTATTY